MFIRLFLLLAIFAAYPLAAQVNQKPQDSTKIQNEEMYKKLEDYSKRKKFTKFVHKLIFRPVKAKEPSQSRRKLRDKTPELLNTYNKYQGKIVRNIVVQTLDPFGYSINDTVQKPKEWVQKFGNSVHLKTKEFTIKNLLLFKKNEPLDSLLIKDSERLIRRQRYVRRVAIKALPASASSDSVDVYIRVLDSWSLIPNGSASGSGTSFELTERNFLGLGHEFRNDFDKRFNTGKTSYLARYTINNILNTYITATVNYQIWKGDNNLKSAGLEREFFSAYTKWAGGVYMESRLEYDSLPDAQQVWKVQKYRSDAQDYWGGYAFKIYEGETEEARTTRLVTTSRFYNLDYEDTPTVEYDSIGFYSSQTLGMVSVGLTSRKFVQDKFLFNYDIVEDIPIGKIYSLTGGIQRKNRQNRLYLGGRYAFGNYYSWGYMSINTQIGSFFYKNSAKESAIDISALYFTNIKNLGEWRFRHFIKPSVTIGLNRASIIKDRLDLNNQNGIMGFDTQEIRGTKKLLLTLQTQGYSPWNVMGFRLNPFANITLGVIDGADRAIFENKIYTKIGLGILLYNDYLVFNSFQLSLAYYPEIPGQGQNIFKTNAFQNNDLTLPDFQVGKPTVVPYQ
ncbi:hypothetical protein [Flavobacterium rhizosphaerae]|uniref:Outer membrane protein/protective antigen OMA87 n=1 Tax=Flavobacterium rhizosphaerae TaxID=3163298 RepID=A0ABW8YVW4_9FLAO